jgi:predicted nucleic acid-binding protein
VTSSAVAVVDTNVILRFLLNDHPHHAAQAKTILRSIMSGQSRAFVPEAVWAECVFLLTKTYRVPRGAVAAKLIGLLAYRGMEGASIPVVRNALSLYAEHNIAFADALALSHALSLSGPLITFDAKLARLAKRLQTAAGKSESTAE